MIVRQEGRGRYTVELDDIEAGMVKEQAAKENVPVAQVMETVVRTGWATSFSDSEETR